MELFDLVPHLHPIHPHHIVLMRGIGEIEDLHIVQNRLMQQFQTVLLNNRIVLLAMHNQQRTL